MSRTRVIQLAGVGVLVGVVIVSVLAFIVSPHQQAHAADTGLVTRGDAEAIFNAFNTACYGYLFRQTPQFPTGSPCADRTRAHISIPAIDQHYCKDDWHVVEAGWGVPVDPMNPALVTRGDARAAAAQVTISFVLDDTPLATTTGPVKQANPTASQQQFATPVFGVNNGTLLPPTALPVGTHTLITTIVDPVESVSFSVTTIFEMDSSGTGVCLLP